MSRTAKTVAGSLMMSAILTVTVCVSAETVKYAGTVRAIDHAKGSLVLEDVGPWVAKGPETQITTRTIIGSSSTEYFVADRAKDGTTGFPGDYRESKAQLSDVTPGAFVTVECQPDRVRCMAVKLTVVRTGQP